MQAVSPNVRNALEFLDTQVQRASALVRKVAEVVSQIFLLIVRTIAAILLPQIYASKGAETPFVYQPCAAALEDVPVNMQALRLTLQNKALASVSKRMTVRDFITLIDEFPREQVRIGRWAANWANERALVIDRQHPYFEIFQAAERYRNQIPPEKYEYILNCLMGFQEMSREENRELMRKLDNRRCPGNPAYTYAQALSKIVTYPTTYNMHGDVDIADKLQIGIDAPMTAFRVAQAHNKVLDFFTKGFGNYICFDARVSRMQTFILEVTNPYLQDLSPDIRGKNSTDERILEHYRVFKNRQAFKLAKELGCSYERVKNEMLNGLHSKLYSRSEFAKYLAENNHPVRERNPVSVWNLMRLLKGTHIIPEQQDWNGAIPEGVKKVPAGLVPPHLRKVGAVLGVKDPSVYVVTVLDPLEGLVAFSETKADRIPPNRIISYGKAWKGTDLKKYIDLPHGFWRVGNELGVMDPELYQVKVHRVTDREVHIDFRGEPISRARMDRCLDRHGI